MRLASVCAVNKELGIRRDEASLASVGYASLTCYDWPAGSDQAAPNLESLGKALDNAGRILLVGNVTDRYEGS